LKGQVQRVGHVLGPHVGAELPRDDVKAVIIQVGRQIKPTPAQNFEVPLSPTNVLEGFEAMEQDDNEKAYAQNFGANDHSTWLCRFRHRVGV
jgi:hypothetical protein